jgi:peptidase E
LKKKLKAFYGGNTFVLVSQLYKTNAMEALSEVVKPELFGNQRREIFVD